MKFESVQNKLMAVVGVNRRLSAVTLDNVYRARIDNLEWIVTHVTLVPETAALVETLKIRPISGISDFEIERLDPGDFRIRFRLPRPVGVGTLVPWSYERTFQYVPDPPLPLRGHTSVTGRSRGYRASVSVRFDGPVPPLIWRVVGRKIHTPRDPDLSNLLTPDEDNRVYFPETDETDERHVYGIWWRWS